MVGFVASAVAVAGCSGSSCCGTSERTYHLAGDTLPDASSCSGIVLEFYEGTSGSCSGGCTSTEQIPGNLVLEKKVASAGAWSTDVSIVDAGDSQTIDVLAYCQTSDGKPSFDACIGQVTVPAGNHDAVSFPPGPCRGRL